MALCHSRSSRSKIAWSVAIACALRMPTHTICATVMIPPPPTPVNARKTISWRDVCANDEAKEPKKKTPMPITRSTLRDQMSLRRPYNSWQDVEVRTKGRCTKSVYVLHAVRTWALRTVRSSDPRTLRAGVQIPTHNRQRSGKSRLIHQGKEVNACAGQEYLSA
jgi:hypothetical protein